MDDLRTESRYIMVADVGGTYARFHVAAAGHLLPEVLAPTILRCEDYESFDDLLETAMRKVCMGVELDAVVIAAAGPRDGGTLHFTNRPWVVRDVDLRARTGAYHCDVLNDFGAVAHLVSGEMDHVSRAVGRGRCKERSTRVVLGPGTGLGVAAVTFGDRFVREGAGEYHVVSGEGGNVTFAPGDDVEAALAEALRIRSGRVFAEQLVSGDGLRVLHAWLHHSTLDLDGKPDASEIAIAAMRGDAGALESVHRMFGCLGTIAGDLALTFGARGGVFLTGGVVERLARFLEDSPFRARFEAKGRHQAYVEGIATRLVTASHPGLRGAWRVAHGMLHLDPLPALAT